MPAGQSAVSQAVAHNAKSASDFLPNLLRVLPSVPSGLTLAEREVLQITAAATH